MSIQEKTSYHKTEHKISVNLEVHQNIQSSFTLSSGNCIESVVLLAHYKICYIIAYYFESEFYFPVNISIDRDK